MLFVFASKFFLILYLFQAFFKRFFFLFFFFFFFFSFIIVIFCFVPIFFFLPSAHFSKPWPISSKAFHSLKAIPRKLSSFSVSRSHHFVSKQGSNQRDYDLIRQGTHEINLLHFIYLFHLFFYSYFFKFYLILFYLFKKRKAGFLALL